MERSRSDGHFPIRCRLTVWRSDALKPEAELVPEYPSPLPSELPRLPGFDTRLTSHPGLMGEMNASLGHSVTNISGPGPLWVSGSIAGSQHLSSTNLRMREGRLAGAMARTSIEDAAYPSFRRRRSSVQIWPSKTCGVGHRAPAHVFQNGTSGQPRLA